MRRNLLVLAVTMFFILAMDALSESNDPLAAAGGANSAKPYAVATQISTESRQVARFEFELPEGQQLGSGSQNLAVSPNGKQVAYSTPKGLYLRSLDDSTSKLISGTEENVRTPFFSPDGKWIGYLSVAERKLKKIPVEGGTPVVLVELTAGFSGASWSANDTIIFAHPQLPGDIMKMVAQANQGQSQNAIQLTQAQIQQALSQVRGELMQIPANGGTPEPLFTTKSGLLRSPIMLPGEKSVLYVTSMRNSNEETIMLQSLVSGESKALFGGSTAHYLSTGHIVYAAGDIIYAVKFDPDKLEVTGKPMPVIENVEQYAVSDSGTLVYAPTVPPRRTLVWVDRQGKEEQIAAPPNAYVYPKISTDGTRLAFGLSIDGNWDIGIWNFQSGSLTRLTFDKGRDLQPVWTQDGKRIIFASNRDENTSVYWKAADGSGKEEKVLSISDRSLFPMCLSSDGKTLVMSVAEGNPATSDKWDFATLSMKDRKTWKPLLHEEYTLVQPQISPDGKWIAYVEGDTRAVFVRPFPDVDTGKWRVSPEIGHSPRWSPDGRELFFLTGNSDAMMAVKVQTEPTFKPGEPETLFRGRYLSPLPGNGTPYDVHPDGKRFLMIKPQDNAGTQKLNIIVNWLDEVKSRVPVR